MDSEFVNVFIEKQREVINDLTARNIMLETRVAVAELKLNSVPQLLAEHEEASKTVIAERDNLLVKLQDMQTQLDSMRKLVGDLATKATKVAKDINLT